jgi:hypothetical protein
MRDRFKRFEAPKARSTKHGRQSQFSAKSSSRNQIDATWWLGVFGFLSSMASPIIVTWPARSGSLDLARPCWSDVIAMLQAYVFCGDRAPTNDNVW